MERYQLRRQVAVVKQSLFDQGYLDEQFVQLEELQDTDNPNFVEEVVTLFFRDSARMIVNIEQAMERSPLDFNRLDNYMHQFKGSSSSIGAKKVKEESTQFREYCRTGNADGCMRSFQQVKKEHATLKKKLESYFQLARQAGPAETAGLPVRN
ncbi:histidine-containing phosphotransfer protein 4-like [Macadamia integrifolia]|uniref:histidine-containing phosphotransfer protein 4-like n=1 Tax=Macadamia integrifolia TaxID=60698 RepID=UPI001C4F1CED|nr:histidine-containing phosphotransfer protein 4-like [Macadamia integrifolia]